jgi:hypothetical protein
VPSLSKWNIKIEVIQLVFFFERESRENEAKFKMKQVLVISYSNLKSDARVKRQIAFLKKMGFQVTAACYDSEDAEVKLIKIEPPNLSLVNKAKSGALLLLRRYTQAYQILYGQRLSLNQPFDLIIANDIEALPLAFQYKGHAKIVFDAHEYAPRHFENKLSWRIFFQGFNKFFCATFIPQVDGMMTIGEGIANEYEKHYGVRPVIITNAPSFYDIQPNPTNPKKIRLVHQGIANPSRKLELMFDMMEHLDERFTLDLMLMTPVHRSNVIYLEKLKKLANQNPRIQFVAPVSTDKIIPTLNPYDMGIVLIPPINFNYQNTLPNKFFECIQARVALAIGPIPEMKKITEKFELGVVSRDFTAKSLAQKINLLTAESINHFKNNTTRAAHELNADKNEIIFTNLINGILEN